MTGNEFVAVLRTSLTRLYDEVADLLLKHGPEPASGSIAASERATYQRPESVTSVWFIGIQLLDHVGEHVNAFVKGITEPVQPIECWTCVRSMLESSSIAGWLCQPEIDVNERMKRLYAYRYEGMEQELKLLRAMKRPTAEITTHEDHINEVEKIAVGLGFAPVLNSKSKRIGIGMQMPTATSIIEEILDEDVAYRLLSAVAHGHVWAINKLAFKPAGEAVKEADGVTRTAFQKHSGTVESYNFLAIRAAKSFGLPAWNYCRYLGCDTNRLVTILESVYDAVGWNEGVRFWRPKAGSSAPV